jgi:hypothetical protein
MLSAFKLFTQDNLKSVTFRKIIYTFAVRLVVFAVKFVVFAVRFVVI